MGNKLIDMCSVYMQGRHEEAEAVFLLLHGDSSDPENTFAHKEYLIMQSQLSLEAEKRLTITAALKQPSMRKRFILGWLTMSGTQFSGLLVILSKLLLIQLRYRCRQLTTI
jgi:hypothetical protein